MEILLLGKKITLKALYCSKCMFLTMFVHKNRNMSSKEWDKKLRKIVFIDHTRNIRTKPSQLDEDVHIYKHTGWLRS